MAYATYKDIPSHISWHEDFEGNSAKAETKSNGWYVIYSYNTIMAIVLPNNKAVVNTSHYSPTTSRLQNIIKNYLNAEFICVEPRGAWYAGDNAVMEHEAEQLAS